MSLSTSRQVRTREGHELKRNAQLPVDAYPPCPGVRACWPGAESIVVRDGLAVTVVHGSRARHSGPLSCRCLCDADRFRASKFQHAIQRTGSNFHFGCSACIRA